MPFQIAGAKYVDPANRNSCFFKMVGASYFRALGMHLEKGRFLDAHDVKGALPVAVINEAMVKRFFPKGNPVGQRILVDQIVFGETKLGPEIPWEIVGIVADEKIGGLDSYDINNPGMYVTADQSPQTYESLVIKGQTDSPLMMRSVKEAILRVNKDQIITDVKTLEELKYESVAGIRFRSALMTIFAAVALLLAAIGLYGVISYSVVQRTREIGIRAALGADPRRIQALVLRGAMILTAAGLAIGALGAGALARFLSSLLFNVGQYDPGTFIVVAGVLALVALLASLIPARKAMRVDPIVALRQD